jgi:hypothetical protein
MPLRASWVEALALQRVARIERSEIRDCGIHAATPPRVSLALNPGYDFSARASFHITGAAPLSVSPQSSGSTLTMEAPWLLPVQKDTGVVVLST